MLRNQFHPLIAKICKGVDHPLKRGEIRDLLLF